MVFTDSVGVLAVNNEESLGEYAFDTKCVQFDYNLQVHFGVLRERNLRKWGIYHDWSQKVYEFGIFDLNSNTVRTIRPYFSDDQDFSSAKEHNVNVIEISCHHEYEYIGNST